MIGYMIYRNFYLNFVFHIHIVFSLAIVLTTAVGISRRDRTFVPDCTLYYNTLQSTECVPILLKYYYPSKQ